MRKARGSRTVIASGVAAAAARSSMASAAPCWLMADPAAQVWADGPAIVRRMTRWRCRARVRYDPHGLLGCPSPGGDGGGEAERTTRNDRRPRQFRSSSSSHGCVHSP